MQSEHSVSSHLHLDTTQYDRIIRTYIPHYDESRGVQLDLLSAALIPGANQIVDLGGGTGSLAEAILDDAVSGPFWPSLRDEWAAFMARQGFTLEQAYQNLDSWAAEDMYFSVYEELCAMAQAGFEHPECFWRRGPIAVLGARV